LLAHERIADQEPALGLRLAEFIAGASAQVDRSADAVAQRDMAEAALALGLLARALEGYEEFGGSVAIVLRPAFSAA
jgi:hypothetical protein